MKIDSVLIKKLRGQKNWSQEQLSEACGLSLRTIQRLESSGNASIDSVNALAAVFSLEPNELILPEEEAAAAYTPIDAIKSGFIKFADFSGTATRFEYWWFVLFFLLVVSIAAVISDAVVQIVTFIILIPLIAAGTRRLNDTGRSGWWQLFFLVPFGMIVVFILLAQESKDNMTSSEVKSLNAV